MSKLTQTKLKKELALRDADELIEEILHLYELFPPVREYFQIQCTSDETDVLARYKAIIKKEFFPDRGEPKTRLHIARQAILDFRKISQNQLNIADIMLYYVEIGAKFTAEYGDCWDAFYDSLETMYNQACKYIVQYDLLDMFARRARAIVDDTRDCGWGFHDVLGDTYYQYWKT